MNPLANPVLRAEVRDSAPAWLAVGLTFVTVTFGITLSAMVMDSGFTAIETGQLSTEEGYAVAVNGGVNLALVAAVALAVISAATGLVVAARRPAIARLALAGATPGQIVGLTMGQLVAVTLTASVVGSGLAVLFLPTALDSLAAERGQTAPDAVVQLGTILQWTLAAVVLAVLGGLRQARVAAAVGPLEAAREASTGGKRLSRANQVLRLAGALLILGAVTAVIFALPPVAEALDDLAGSTVLQLCVAVLPLTGLGLALAAPVFLAPITSAWTRLVPGRDVAWHLASRTVVARSERLVRSVIPVMFAIGLILGMVTIGATFNASFAANGSEGLSGTSTRSVLNMLGLALAVAVSGSVGNLVMMSRAREGELAVAGLAGATPAQRVGTTVYEALILTVTGTALAGVMTLSSVVALRVGLPQLMPESEVVIPVGGALVVALVVGAIITLATTAPVLPSLHRPERAVVAARIAD